MSLISDYDVVVIGAGAAGLAASAELMAKGKSVICLEAMDRIGGRCYTDHSIFGLPCDIGAHWLHSYSGNKIAQYGLKIGNEFDVYKLKENVLVYDENKKTDGSRLYSVINQIKSLKDKYSKSNSNSQIIDVPFLDLIPDEVKNNEWFDTAHQALGACLEGVDFHNFTTADALLNFKSSGEGDGFVKQGYGALLSHYRQNVSVTLNTIVNEIDWSGSLLKIKTNQGTISSKKCIVTVSTNVLAKEILKFTPMLPIEKYEAFSNIKLGFYNHILIQFTDSFYKNFNIKKDTYLFSKITTKSLSPIGFFGSLKLHNFNLSYFDVGGGFAEELENAGENAAKDFILELLKSTFGSDIKKYIIKYHVTSWGRNKYFLGSYSSAIPGKSHFREILKTSIDDKIFFAGEAVSSNYGTVHGADATGIYSAEEVMRLI